MQFIVKHFCRSKLSKFQYCHFSTRPSLREVRLSLFSLTWEADVEFGRRPSRRHGGEAVSSARRRSVQNAREVVREAILPVVDMARDLFGDTECELAKSA